MGVNRRLRELIPKAPATALAMDRYDLWRAVHVLGSDKNSAALLIREPALLLPALDLFALLYKPAPVPRSGTVAPLCRALLARLLASGELTEMIERTHLDEWAVAAALGPLIERLHELLEDARADPEGQALAEATRDLLRPKKDPTGAVTTASAERLDALAAPIPPLAALLVAEDVRLRERVEPDSVSAALSACTEGWADAPQSPFEDPVGDIPQSVGEQLGHIEDIAREMALLMEHCAPHGRHQGGQSQIPMEQAIWLGEVLARHPEIRRIVDLAGRLTETLRRKTPQGKSDKGMLETHAIEIGGNLARLLPGELCLLGHPVFRRVLLARLVERRALEYQIRGPIRRARGPVILVVDASGSMQGGRTLFAKALLLGLGLLCWERRRPFVLITFGARGQLREEQVPAGTPFWPRIRRSLGVVFGGGTDFDTPLRRVCALADGSPGDRPFGRADAIFVTDGEGSVSPDVCAELQRVRSRCDLQLIGCLLGPGTGLVPATDIIYQIDPVAVGTMSARSGNTIPALPLLQHISGRL